MSLQVDNIFSALFFEKIVLSPLNVWYSCQKSIDRIYKSSFLSSLIYSIVVYVCPSARTTVFWLLQIGSNVLNEKVWVLQLCSFISRLFWFSRILSTSFCANDYKWYFSFYFHVPLFITNICKHNWFSCLSCILWLCWTRLLVLRSF